MTTICGTDLHILKGDVPACEPGGLFGSEGVLGIIEKIGQWRHNVEERRSCSDFLHNIMRKM